MVTWTGSGVYADCCAVQDPDLFQLKMGEDLISGWTLEQFSPKNNNPIPSFFPCNTGSPDSPDMALAIFHWENIFQYIPWRFHLGGLSPSNSYSRLSL